MRSDRIGVGGALLAGLLGAAGCVRGSDDGATFAAILLRDRVIGSEERTAARDGDVLVVRRARTYADGASETTLRLDPSGAALEASSRSASGEVHTWAASGAPAVVLDESAALLASLDAPRTVAVFDPGGLVVRDLVLQPDGDVVRYTVDGLDGVLAVEGDRVVRHALGSLVVEARPDRPVLDDVSVESLLSLPAPSLSGARTARTSTWTVDGEPVVVTAPLPAEVPRATRDRLAAAVAAVEGASCLPRSRALVAALGDEGLDAKGVVGLVYLDGRLAPHAWVEVRLGDLVVPVDPTLGQPVADAARLALADDGPEAPWRLLATLDSREVALVELR